ncbi:MAG: hypothetical protein JWN40_5145 [Phycisphaerales bacterium]|nr:hypothetical protein [Phycisphaerales bacterium]
MGSGTWLVIGILALGVALAVVGVTFRRLPDRDRTVTAPATTQATAGR